MTEPPRRYRLDRYVQAETAIRNAMLAVESMPPDVRLTDAVVLLGMAKDSVADYVDGVERRDPNADRDTWKQRAEAAESETDEVRGRAELFTKTMLAIRDLYEVKRQLVALGRWETWGAQDVVDAIANVQQELRRTRAELQQQADGWITCYRMPPADGAHVLVTNGLTSWEAVAKDGAFLWRDPITGGQCFKTIIAWRPMPRPPKA
jgi:hypothetical protein